MTLGFRALIARLVRQYNVEYTVVYTEYIEVCTFSPRLLPTYIIYTDTQYMHAVRTPVTDVQYTQAWKKD